MVVPLFGALLMGHIMDSIDLNTVNNSIILDTKGMALSSKALSLLIELLLN